MREILILAFLIAEGLGKNRDINAALNGAKRQIARDHGDRYCLDGKVLRRATEMEGRPREKLFAGGHRKLATLAAKEGMAPHQLLDELSLEKQNGQPVVF